MIDVPGKRKVGKQVDERGDRTDEAEKKYDKINRKEKD